MMHATLIVIALLCAVLGVKSECDGRLPNAVFWFILTIALVVAAILTDGAK